MIFVDIETLRGRPYPDVLIELLVNLLDSLKRRLKEKGGWVDVNRSRRRTRKELAHLTATLRRLLNEPQTAERIIKELQSSTQSAGAGAGLDVKMKKAIHVRAGAELDRSQAREETREARVEESKMDGLLSAAVLIRGALADAQKHLDEGTMLVVLDDFYHVPYENQPDVLAYLHQIVKNLGIQLKVCGVRHRINPFVEGDPPRGMQVGQDAGEVSLDITLERFTTAQNFLEEVLKGKILKLLEIDLETLISEGGRQRLALGSGGVARDYIYLTQNGLRIANERDANPSRLHNRIGGEDVNEAAARLSAQKQQDLRLDAGEDADKLRERLNDIVKFCLDVNTTNIFLVEGPLLQEEEWGKEIQGRSPISGSSTRLAICRSRPAHIGGGGSSGSRWTSATTQEHGLNESPRSSSGRRLASRRRAGRASSTSRAPPNASRRRTPTKNLTASGANEHLRLPSGGLGAPN